MKSMEDVMLLHVRQLCAVFAGEHPGGENEKPAAGSEKKSVVRNMGDWFGYLTYDVMGELCFGKSFDMLVSSGKRELVGLVDRAANRHYVVSYLAFELYSRC